MKSAVMHARFGTAAEFSEGNLVVPANILVVVQDENGATTELRVGDGVTEFESLPVLASPVAPAEPAA